MVMSRSRRALTSSDVRAAHGSGRLRLEVVRGTLVTALAAETARDLGVSIEVVPGPARAAAAPGDPPGPGSLEDRVRQLVRQVVGEAHTAPAPARGSPGPRPPVRHVDARDVRLTPFPFPGPEPGQDVRVADVVTSEHGSPMGAGFLTLTRGCFPWTLTYDEVEYVVEGELHIGTEDGVVVGRPGDVLYVPKGTAITFGTPSWAKFLYVTYPADWGSS
jgi:ethanolamine utilization protein EutQ